MAGFQVIISGRFWVIAEAFDLEMLSKEVGAIHKTFAGGFAAFLAKGSTGDNDSFSALFEAADRVDVAKLLWEGSTKSANQQ